MLVFNSIHTSPKRHERTNEIDENCGTKTVSISTWKQNRLSFLLHTFDLRTHATRVSLSVCVLSPKIIKTKSGHLLTNKIKFQIKSQGKDLFLCYYYTEKKSDVKEEEDNNN